MQAGQQLITYSKVCYPGNSAIPHVMQHTMDGLRAYPYPRTRFEAQKNVILFDGDYGLDRLT